MAREDLSPWDISNQLRVIREHLIKEGKSKGDIEVHLSKLIGKDIRTVRRYLRISSIQGKGKGIYFVQLPSKKLK